ncbi:hypothetical protein [uncultured Amnibacterium sp.]|uniref:hypothetical protein n=1 Tax=uncultured Amnibacterium sp. TaxID=1631851 RepID=UPI0035C965F1
MLIPDQAAPTGNDAALELALLQRLVDEVPLPPPLLPGWQSLAAAEYARSVRSVAASLAAASAAFTAARAS